MAAEDWARFDALVSLLGRQEPSRARAHGQAIARLMHEAGVPREEPGPLDWMDWERRKTLRLLRPGA